MAYKQRPYAITDGGTGATTVGGAQAALFVAASSATMLLNGSNSMQASMSMGSYNITNLADPTSAQMAATKNYVDNSIIGINTKTSVRLATTANITSLSSGAPSTVDGVALNVNDYILVKNQSTASQNGIYTVTTVGTGSNGVWARSTGDNVSADIVPGMYVFVGLGSTQASTAWILTTDETITLGTTSLNFIQFAASSTYTASNGVQLVSNNFSAVAANSTITIAAGGISVSATYPGNTSLVTLGTITTGTWNGTSIGVAYGGTGATSASGALTNLGAAPNTPSYWTSATNASIANAVVPSVTSGLTLTVATGTFGIDSTVVATTTNTLTMSNKTLTAPNVNSPIVAFKGQIKTAAYALVAADAGFVAFNITSSATATLPASSGVSQYVTYSIKNKKGSTANVSVVTSGSDTGEGSSVTSSTGYTLVPGDSVDFHWDGVEWVIS